MNWTTDKSYLVAAGASLTVTFTEGSSDGEDQDNPSDVTRGNPQFPIEPSRSATNCTYYTQDSNSDWEIHPLKTLYLNGQLRRAEEKFELRNKLLTKEGRPSGIIDHLLQGASDLLPRVCVRPLRKPPVVAEQINVLAADLQHSRRSGSS